MERQIEQPKFFALGDSALTVDFGNAISLRLNARVQRLRRIIEREKFDWIVELVPAYSSLAVFYDAALVRRKYADFATAFDAVRFVVERILPQVAAEETARDDARLVEVPICFDAEFAPDLEFVAETNNLNVEAVKAIFLAEIYTVFMLGFLPGFAYLGEVSDKIATARKDQPRTNIAAGSVGIAGRQTGIYPLESPGGWQIIGRTPLRLFDANADAPALFAPGDAVQFYEIGKNAFVNFNLASK